MIFFFTGWVTIVSIITAALWLQFLQELPSLFENSTVSSITAMRWTFAIIFSAVIFIVGWKTNRKKVTRMNSAGKSVEASPNTIFFVPLQYWAFVFLLAAGCAITVWGIDGR